MQTTLTPDTSIHANSTTTLSADELQTLACALLDAAHDLRSNPAQSWTVAAGGGTGAAMSEIITSPADEIKGLKGHMEVLQYFKNDALERLADNDRVIAAQKERIEILEYHLGRCRDSAYQMCYATVGVLPAGYTPDAKPAKKSKAKS